ncbi:MAG: hypothetical protein ABL967_06440 [Bryobacteraceae bacterium]
MTGFSQRAVQLLEAAEAASASGLPCSETTVLIDHNGSLHFAMDSDWPLDSLRAHRGAQAAYRITSFHGQIRVEGCDSSHTLRLEGTSPMAVARALLGAGPQHY